MVIVLGGFVIRKTEAGEYRLGKLTVIDKWANDVFYDQFDIFDEKAWANFILGYRKNGVPLKKTDEFGDRIGYAIISRGCDITVREHFGNKNQVSAFLFPQVPHLNDDDKTEPLLSHNKKYIWKYM